MAKLGDAFRKAGMKVPEPGTPKETEGGGARKCERCGKDFVPRESYHRTCPECFDGGRGARGSGPPRPEPAGKGCGQPETSLPREALLDRYYDADGRLCKEVYRDAALAAARAFTDSGLTATGVRKFFAMVKALDHRAESEADVGVGDVRAAVHKLVPLVKYQHGRGIVPACFVEFIERNVELASRDARSFHGFVEFFTSVLCYMKQK
jgi:CRISPR type III-A-associated protein Csm2